MADYHYLYSTHPSFLLERLIKQYKTQDRLVIAYDFDDTISPYWCSDCSDVQSVLRMCRNTLDAYFICYTSNDNMEKVKNFIKKYDIPCDAINEDAPFAPVKGGKIFYNVFLDDKAGLGETVSTLKQLLSLVKNEYIKKEINNWNDNTDYHNDLVI